MKIRKSFVANSSSTCFALYNKTHQTKKMSDFIREVFKEYALEDDYYDHIKAEYDEEDYDTSIMFWDPEFEDSTFNPYGLSADYLSNEDPSIVMSYLYGRSFGDTESFKCSFGD